MIRSARNPVDEVKLLYVLMKLEDLNAKIQCFKVLQVLTISQKLQRMMLQRKRDKMLQKLFNLCIKGEYILDNMRDSLE